MGHSASIARKYQTSQSGPNEETRDEADSLATVSSYRPTSPAAHSDAQEFTLDIHQGHRRTQNHYGYPVHGPLPIGYRTTGSLGYRQNGTTSSSILGMHPFRSMQEVRHYLVKNPELLSGKHFKNSHNSHQFDDFSDQHRQIKTKQKVYLGLLDPPTVYGCGVDRDKQLKVKQRLYLQLVSPAVNGLEYYSPAMRSRVLLKSDEMVVVRRDENVKSSKPLQERSRPPLKGGDSMPAIKAEPEQARISTQRRKPQRNSSQHSSVLSRREPTRIPNGDAPLGAAPPNSLQTSTPRGAIPKRHGNEYVDMKIASIKESPTRMGKQKRKEESQVTPDAMEVERRYRTDSLERGNSKPKDSDDVVFTYDVEDLGLKKKVEVAEKPKDRGKVVPLYFRKSLAYNPKYSKSEEILSDPL